MSTQIKCPICGNVCESDFEVAIGQHIICPFCENKFAYEAHTVLDAEAAPQYVPGYVSIDLSDDKMASFYRWFKAIETVIMCGFSFDALYALYQSLSAGTIIGSLIYVFAGIVLVGGISRGARWARISTYVLVVLEIVALAGTASEFDVVLGILSIVLFGLASLMMLLPKVSRALKDLGRNSKPTGIVCVVFWLLFLISHIIVAAAPADKGLFDYHINTGVLIVVGIILSPVLCFCGGLMLALINGVSGGAATPAEVVSSKMRNVTCPKCGQAICVPDTDDNGQEICPSCKHKFFPFGYSGFAYNACLLGLFSWLIFPAPFALLLGWLALKDIKANRGKHGITGAWIGVIMGAIGTFLLAFMLLIGIIATVLGPR